MFVLLYVNTDGQPCFTQGTMAEINAHVRKAFVDGEINHEDWEFSSPFEMLCIEDGALTPVNSWGMRPIPQFEVD